MAELSKGSLFDPVLINDLITKVRGKSSLAKLSRMTPVSFVGNKEFIFNMDSEIDIVAENAQKKDGGATLTPVTIVPIKFVYGMRVSDEFMFAAEEEQIAILQAFNDGFSKKVASGLDQAAFHGINPSTGTASTVIGDNHFDKKVTQTVTLCSRYRRRQHRSGDRARRGFGRGSDRNGNLAGCQKRAGSAHKLRRRQALSGIRVRRTAVTPWSDRA